MKVDTMINMTKLKTYLEQPLNVELTILLITLAVVIMIVYV